MIAVKENRQSLEQKIVELVSEYQALKIEQVEKYFGLPSETMAKAFRMLVKKGRVVLEQDTGVIKVSKGIKEDEKQGIPHYLIDVLMPDEEFSAGAGNVSKWERLQRVLLYGRR